MSREAKLQELLCRLFTVEELRSFVGQQSGKKARDSLPGGNSSLAEFVTGTIEALDRHGALNGAFFQGLVAERPLKFLQIAELATLWGASVQPPAEKPPALEQGPKKDPLFSLELLFRGRKVYFAILVLALWSGAVWLMSELSSDEVIISPFESGQTSPNDLHAESVDRLYEIVHECAQSLNISTKKFTVYIRELEGRWNIAFFDSHHSAIELGNLGFDPSLGDKLKVCISGKLQDMPPVQGIRSGEVSLEDELDQPSSKPIKSSKMSP